MSALDRKLGRDLGRLAAQGFTIALVVAAGIAAFSSLRTVYSSLVGSREAYYERERMPDLWATVTRAPEPLAARLALVPGVASLETRIEGSVKVMLPNVPDPPTGRVISIPTFGMPRLAGLVLRSGRLPEPRRDDEALLLESFATAQHLSVGAEVDLVVLGTMRHVRVVGIAMSPEFVMPMALGDFTPDPERMAVFWMRRDALAPLLDLEGAFDSIVVDVGPGFDRLTVARTLERSLERYGAASVVERDHVPSDHVLEGELSQLRGLSTVVPFIFLGVSAFLVHVVLSRLLQLQRGQIAMLRAIGYTRLEVARHYLALVSLIVLFGTVVGLLVGHRLGIALTELYVKYFHFPDRVYRFDLGTAVVAVAASGGSAFTGAVSTLWSVTSMPPAAAMQPPVPAVQRLGFMERIGLMRAAGPVLAMILREIRRKPVRALFSSVGIAFSVAIVIVGRFGYDSMGTLIEVEFHEAIREDVIVGFQRSVDRRAVSEIAHLPGVIRAEGFRMAAARVRHRAVFRDVPVQAFEDGAMLRRIVDRLGHAYELPRSGVFLTDALARILGVRLGDEIELEWLEGERRITRVRITGLVEEPLGMQVYASSDDLRRYLRESPRVSGVALRVDRSLEAQLLAALRQRPLVGMITRKQQLIDRFASQSGEQMRTFTIVLSIFAAVIAIGVVYNNARVSLSMRERDLASLRVLGFTRGEISAVLLGELAIHVAVGVPAGLVLGRDWALRVAATVDPETYRMPVVIAASSYALAAGVVLAASAVSALLVRRHLDHLDLIAVLKTRE